MLPAFLRLPAAAQLPRALAWPVLLALALTTAGIPAAGAVTGAAQAATVGEPGHFLFKSYGAELGLSNVNIFRLLQDRAGFIWAGTEDGLYRYDGYRFAPFGMQDGLLSSSITALFEDDTGRLWVGTQAGLSQRAGRRFSPVAAPSGMPPLAIAGIAQSAEGIWAATPRGPYVGQARFAAAPGWPGGEATAILGSKKSAMVWVAQWNGAAHVLAYRDGRWSELKGPPGQTQERIDAIAEDGAGHIWVRTASTLWTARPGAARFELVATPIPVTSSVGYLSTGPRGDLYVSSDVGVLRRAGQGWEAITARQGLPGAPWPVLEDREGSLWIGSVGLHRLLGRGVFRAFNGAEGLPNEVVWSVLRGRDARLWVGTSAGLAVLERGAFRTIGGTEKYTVRSISEGADGTLYLGGVPGNEVLSYHPATGTLRRHALGATLDSKRIFRVLAGKDRMLWASTDGAGLWRADTGAGALSFAQVAVPGGSATEYMSDVSEDAAGTVWVAGQHGLAMHERGSWRRFTRADGLLHDHVAYVRPLADGSLLLPYFNPLGVSRARHAAGRLALTARYDAASTRSADKVFFAGTDASDRIWIGGGRGVDLLTATGTQHFGAAEGLVGEDTTSMSFLAEPNGDVWFGTSKGLQHFSGTAFAALPAPQPPSTVLMHVVLGGASVDAAAQRVQVAHDNTFEVQYAGMSYVGEGQLQYRQRLQGREQDFNIVDNRSARYSALQHGHYRFEVAARVGAHGAWGPAATFSFEVLPAWWETWWLRTLGALGAMLLLLLAYRWRVARLRRENLRLETLVAQRTSDLQSANQALQHSSMIDPLTGLKNRRYLDVFMPEELARTLRQQRDGQQRGARQRDGQHSGQAAGEHNTDLCLIMVDLDHFKIVNDEHGHAAGDKVLSQVAMVMRNTCRMSDVVVRWGGEEFLIIARNMDRRHGQTLAAQLCAAIRGHDFDIGNGKILKKTCSVGYTAFPLLRDAPEKFGWEQGVELADRCLYAAKRSGRDGWVGCLLQEPQLHDLADAGLRRHDMPDFGPALVLSSWPTERDLQWQ